METVAGPEKWQSEMETCWMMCLHRNRKYHEDVAERVLRKWKERRCQAENWT